MRITKKKMSRIGRSLSALVLACGILLPMAPRSEALDIRMGKTTFYHYRWIQTQQELIEYFPKDQWVEVLLAWRHATSEDNQTDIYWYAAYPTDGSAKRYKGYYSSSSNLSDKTNFTYTTGDTHYLGSDDFSSATAKIFTVQEKMGTFRIKRVGTDDNKDNAADHNGSGTLLSPKFQVGLVDGWNRYYLSSKSFMYRLDRGSRYESYAQLIKEGVATSGRIGGTQYNVGSPFEFTVKMFQNESKKNDRNYPYGAAWFFRNLENVSDDMLRHKSNYIEMSPSTDYDDDDEWMYPFRIYYRTEETFDCLMEDYRVQNGVTYRVNDKVLVNDGVTITVENGGTMVINAQMFLNGDIIVEEGGTLIINEGAHVLPFYSDQSMTPGAISDCGTIRVEGGNLLVMEDAMLLCDHLNSALIITKGGSVVNHGCIMPCHLKVDDNGKFLNQETGTLVMGRYLGDERGSIVSITPEELLENAKMRNDGECSLSVYGNGQFVNRGIVDATANKTLGNCGAEAVIQDEGSGKLNGDFYYIAGFGPGMGLFHYEYMMRGNGYPVYRGY